MACFFCGATPIAHGEASLFERFEAVFDGIVRGLNAVGEKSEDLVGPSFRLPFDLKTDDLSGLMTVERNFEQSLPVPSKSTISISNEFGRVNITTWDSPVVRVTAGISVGANDAETALEVADAVQIKVNQDGSRLEVNTLWPDTRDLGAVPIEVNYTLTVPRDASLVVDNYFGDTSITGVGGALTLRARYGEVHLADITGRVQVRSVGEFAVAVERLTGGGEFVLRGSLADFRGVAGELVIGNYLGKVELREIDEEARVEIVSESGPIHVYLAEEDEPEIIATAHFGGIETDVELDVLSRGNLTVARKLAQDATQSLSLTASFDSIYLHQANQEPERQEEPTGLPIKDEITESTLMASGGLLSIEAIAGDVIVEGNDSNQLTVKATRFVRVDTTSSARAALEALTLHLESDDARQIVRSAALEDMEALGCSSYRMDLLIQCPRDLNLHIGAVNGRTLVRGLAGSVQIDQAEGAIGVEHIKGTLVATNRKGNITVAHCAGPVTVSGTYGSVDVRDVFGKINASALQGDMVIDAPRGDLVVRSKEGDVRIIALEGVGGNYDALVDQGDLSVVLPAALDATLLVTARRGSVYSTIPLTGTLNRDVQQFQARLTNGTRSLALEAKGGNVRIDSTPTS